MRIAIGADIGEEVILKKNKIIKKNLFKRLLLRLLGIQVELLRVKKSTYADMEIRVCRISKEVMKIIGVEEGDFVEIESINSSVTIRALELTKSLRERKLKVYKNTKNEPSCSKLLELDKKEDGGLDLPPILI